MSGDGEKEGPTAGPPADATEAGARPENSVLQAAIAEEAALRERRLALDAELRARRPAAMPSQEADPTSQGWGRGAKLASEFVAGILVGAAIGWFFDRLLGTSPWGLIVFLMFGFAAGTLNAMRSAGVVPEPEHLRAPGREEDGGAPAAGSDAPPPVN